jgi:hypothetical protein
LFAVDTAMHTKVGPARLFSRGNCSAYVRWKSPIAAQWRNAPRGGMAKPIARVDMVMGRLIKWPKIDDIGLVAAAKSMQVPSPIFENPERLACARCGTMLECGARSAGPCWCTTLPPLTKVDASLNGCMCPTCLADALARQGKP